MVAGNCVVRPIEIDQVVLFAQWAQSPNHLFKKGALIIPNTKTSFLFLSFGLENFISFKFLDLENPGI